MPPTDTPRPTCTTATACVTLLAVAALLPRLAAGTAAPPRIPDSVAGMFRVAFAGTSTLHGFDGAVAPQPLEVRRIAGAEIWAAEANVPVAAMDTGNAWRDANVRAMFEAGRFPTITATFPAIEPSRARPASGEREGSLPFALRIRDVTWQVLGMTSTWREQPGAVSFDVRFEVSLAAFGLEAPSALGVVRVGDAVAVTVHVELHEAA